MRGGASARASWGRGTEWFSSVGMFGFALILAMPGDTLTGESWAAFRAAGLDEAVLIALLITVAMARATALWINGAWSRSPLLRLVGALCGAFIFGSIAAAFALPYLGDVLDGGPLLVGPSTAVSTYLTFAGFDVVAAGRAAGDLHIMREKGLASG